MIEKKIMNYDYLCEKKLSRENPELHRVFMDNVVVLQRILTSYQAIFPSYTDHSALHSMQVINFCNRLIGENIDKLNSTEAFVLLMACYMHDTGMGIPEKEFDEYFNSLGLVHTDNITEIHDNIRSFHNEFSSIFILKHKNFFDFANDEMAKAIAMVARGHRKVDLSNEEEYPYLFGIPSYGDVHIPYLATLVRLADEIDIASDRISEMLVDYDVVAKDEKCVREYEKHHAIKHLEITDCSFIMQVKTEDDTLFAEIEQLKEKVGETLLYCRNIIETRTPFSLSQSEIIIERL